MNKIYNVARMRNLLLLFMAACVAPILWSCADDQFEGDEKYERFGEIDSFPMFLITPEALQGTWNCGNSKVTFTDQQFEAVGTALGTVSGNFLITGNSIRVYKDNERVGYFPIIYFKRYMVIRHNRQNYSFFRDGDDPNEVINEDDKKTNDPKEPTVEPIGNSSFWGRWSVAKAKRDGEDVYLDVNWTNSRLALYEDGTFTANYWLGMVDDSEPYSPYFTPLGGTYSIDAKKNILLKSKKPNLELTYKFIDADIRKYLKSRNTITGEEVWEERIVSITYSVKKDGHDYRITFCK